MCSSENRTAKNPASWSFHHILSFPLLASLLPQPRNRQQAYHFECRSFLEAWSSKSFLTVIPSKKDLRFFSCHMLPFFFKTRKKSQNKIVVQTTHLKKTTRKPWIYNSAKYVMNAGESLWPFFFWNLWLTIQDSLPIGLGPKVWPLRLLMGRIVHVDKYMLRYFDMVTDWYKYIWISYDLFNSS